MQRISVTTMCCALALGACQPEAISSPEALTPAMRGEDLFQAYCSPCHGAQAQGNGPRASAVSPTPADLTGIAVRNGGLFIADAVASYIDGRADVEAHGPTDMPTWGRLLDDRNEALAEENKLTAPMIADIVAYLETLQREPDAR